MSTRLRSPAPIQTGLPWSMVGSGETRTYRQLDEASRRLALVFRDRGLGPGDHLAVLLENQPAYFEVVWAGLRSGLYVTPINWHLTADEAAYIVDDCGAAGARRRRPAGTRAQRPRRPAGRRRRPPGSWSAVAVAGFERLRDASPRSPREPIDDECEGSWMFYSSGTTGPAEGHQAAAIGAPLGAPERVQRHAGRRLFGFDRGHGVPVAPRRCTTPRPLGGRRPRSASAAPSSSWSSSTRSSCSPRSSATG